MEPANALRFAAAARTLAAEARGHGYRAPGFRCPPRLHGVDRSLRRHAGGAATVAVRLRNRPWAAVLADMVEGIVVANRLSGRPADELRAHLWRAVEGDLPGPVGLQRSA